MTTRREILKLVGGGVVLAAVAGGSFYAVSGPSEKAREAWRQAGTPEQYRQRFLSYALLAPNPHNRQPWLVKLEGEDALTLYCDLDRRLPETDPLDRQITLGCGAFLELLSIAAAQEGYLAEITPFPDGEPFPRLDQRAVARVRFVTDAAQPDPAFAQILKRMTNRNDNTSRVPAADLLASIEVAGGVHGAALRTTADEARVTVLRDHVSRAFERETRNKATHGETVNLLRIGKTEVERWRDGIALEGPMMEGLKLAGLLNAQAMRDPGSASFNQALDMWKAKAASARAFAWIVHDNTRAAQFASGRAYARLDLKVAELGLAVHPFSHSLQEFPEMADLYEAIHTLLGEGRTVQMLVRIGYAAPSIHAPRRGLDAHLIAQG